MTASDLSERWSDEWRSLGSPTGSPESILRAARAIERRLALRYAAELATILGVIIVVAIVIVRGPGIPDALWATGAAAFAVLAVLATIVSRRERLVPLSTDTATFLAAHRRACARRIRSLRVAVGLVAFELIAFVPFTLWRYAPDPTSFASDHARGAAAATLLLLTGALAWLASRLRAAKGEAARIESLGSGHD